jgi:hypothetical protein
VATSDLTRFGDVSLTVFGDGLLLVFVYSWDELIPSAGRERGIMPLCDCVYGY